jgi:hypothetical protein
MILTPAGAVWCSKFPTSIRTADLVDPFRSNVERFIQALKTAGANVSISATYRPSQRAYLMHFACIIAGYRDAQTGKRVQMLPEAVQDITTQWLKYDWATDNVAEAIGIDWTCNGMRDRARFEAAEMCSAYGIVYPPALVSRHTQRSAIDMKITWDKTIDIRGGDGNIYVIQPADNPRLWLAGKSFGVIKLPSDAPHWSDDGH